MLSTSVTSSSNLLMKSKAFFFCVNSKADLGLVRWTDASARTAAYLTWPDTRLRAYLRSKGVDENTLPKTRDALLSTLTIYRTSL
jgi:hypothetical protein